MRKDNPSHATRQPTRPVAVHTRVPEKGRQGTAKTAPGDWTLRIPASFFDARRNDLGHRKGWMLLVLEGYCRARCYCWVGNAELARGFGCSESTLLELLKELEAAGFIHRVPKEHGRHGRVGIILLKRANADLPTATPEELPEVIRLMKETKIGQRDRDRGQGRLSLPLEPEEAPENRGLESQAVRHHDPGKPGAMTPENRGHHDPGKPGAELRVVVVKNDESKNEPPEGGPEDSGFERQRQRPESPPEPAAGTLFSTATTTLFESDAAQANRLEESRRRQLAQLDQLRARENPGCSPAARLHPAPVPLPKPPSPEPAPARPLSVAPSTNEPPGPDDPELLHLLPAEDLALFRAAPEKLRKRLLTQAEMFGVTTTTLGYVRNTLRMPAAIPRPLPETTRELLAALPGAPFNWPVLAAEALVRDFDGPKDRKLWRGFLHVTTAVHEKRFPAEALCDAHRQGMNPGSENRGAVFNTALQRDHGWSWERQNP